MAKEPPMKNRLARLERKVRQQAPETKRRSDYTASTLIAAGTLAVLELTGIQQGPAVYERIGDTIRVKRVEVNVSLGSPLMNVMLVQTMNDQAPVYTDFVPIAGAGLLYNQMNTNFRVLKNYIPLTGSNNIKFTHSFSGGGLHTKYELSSASSGTRNKLYLVIKNGTTTGYLQESATTIFYQDN